MNEPEHKDIKFSVVIPLYNKGKEIARTINSVLAQTYTAFEIVVVDDGSTDSGPDIVMEFADERIRLITQDNGGVSVARNRGISEASYDYISFLDADDEWKPDYLQTVKELIQKFPDAGAYATAYEIIDEDRELSFPRFKGIPNAPWEGYLPSYFKSALGDPPVWTSAVTIPKYVFDIAGNFPEGVVIGQDKEVWERIAMKFPIAFTHKIGASYFLDASNRSCNRNRAKHRPRPFIEIAKNALSNNEIADEMVTDLKRYIAVCQLQRTRIFMFYLGDPTEARAILNDTRPIGLKYTLEKYLLWTLSYIPQPAINYLRTLYSRN